MKPTYEKTLTFLSYLFFNRNLVQLRLGPAPNDHHLVDHGRNHHTTRKPLTAKFDPVGIEYMKSLLTVSLWGGTGLVLIFALASCASVSVQNDSEHATSQMPQKVYVAFFDVSHGKFKVDREGAELADFKSHLQAMMQAGMVEDLTHRLVPAVATNLTKGLPEENAWLIRGEFTKVNQGSRLLRGTIGFGAGGTKLETKVFVYDLEQNTTTPLLTFTTTGGSGAEPGAITAIATDPLTIVVEAAAGGAGGVAHGVTEDTARTAREITANLSDYMYRSGWISKDKWIAPKQVSQ